MLSRARQLSLGHVMGITTQHVGCIVFVELAIVPPIECQRETVAHLGIGIFETILHTEIESVVGLWTHIEHNEMVVASR